MGKFEKLVVLAVLFAAAIVLAISLNRGNEAKAADPLTSAEDLLELESHLPNEPLGPAGTTPPAGGASQAVEGPAPSLLLHAGSEPAGSEPASSPAGLQPGAFTPAATATSTSSTLALEPVSDPSHTILVAQDGLRPSFLDEYMLYTVAEGDTWANLAQRFYQDERYAQNLHLANEGLADLTPGKEILVPVFDFVASDAKAQLTGESAPGSEPVAATTPDGAPVKPLPERVEPGTPREKLPEYEVRAGDTLSDIALAVFGTATRWPELLEANRDRLAKPEALRVGMKLRIPAGGKVPVGKQAETKPKTAQTEKTAAAAKKKKVL